MFGNDLIKSLCQSSDERNLRLSPSDWAIVLRANKNFTETEDEFRGNRLWGRYLLSKIGEGSRLFSQSPSLELCSGNGFLYFSLRDIFSGQVRNHYFVDISLNQCKQFRKRCQEIGDQNERILCGDIGRLPFADNHFNVVYGNSYLHHLPDVPKYLKESHRVLLKGGKFIVFHEPTHTSAFLESFPLSLIKNTRTDSLTDIWNISPVVIDRLLNEAGFSKVSVIPTGFLSSFLVTPLQIATNKIARGQHNSNFFVALKIICDGLDKLVPRAVRARFSPSIAIYAEK